MSFEFVINLFSLCLFLIYIFILKKEVKNEQIILFYF